MSSADVHLKVYVSPNKSGFFTPQQMSNLHTKYICAFCVFNAVASLTECAAGSDLQFLFILLSENEGRHICRPIQLKF